VACGKKEVVSEVVEPVAEVKLVGEKQVEIEKEVKNETPTTESRLNTDGVKMDDLEFRDSIAYFEGSPYTGKGFEMYINGQKQAEMNFKNGKPDGLFTTRYKNGKKQSEMNFKNGKPEGLSIGWYDNGRKLTEVNMDGGKMKVWYRNGQKLLEGNIKDGKEDGLAVLWYADGGKNLEMNFSEGKQHGDAVTWFENGKMRSEEYYRFGIIRAAKYWDNKGEPADSLEEAEGGFNLDQTINRKGLIYLKDSDSPYTGKLFEFHANSLKKKEISLKDGKLDGKELLWSEYGLNKAEINYRDGKKEGSEITWHDVGGQKMTEGNWINGNKDGLWIYRHNAGQKMGEEQWKEGEKVSANYWDIKGEPVDTIEEAIAE